MTKNNRPVLKFHQPFGYDTQNGDLIVSGFSVHTGIFKDGSVEIPESELSNIAESLVGCQLRKDHKFSVDSIVGKITDTKLAMDDVTKRPGVRYQGFVSDEELSGKIQKGLVTDVSIGFGLTPICSKCGEDFQECDHWFDEAHIVAKDIYCEEQSFVAQGADHTSTIEPGANFDSKLNDFQMQFSEKREKLSIQRNSTGYSNANSLIDSEKYDETSSWSFDRATDGKNLLGSNEDDWANYSKWFLATDDSASKNTEAYFKYPFGKDGKVYKSALNAIKQRAGQQNATEIYNMAGKLLEKIASKDKQSEPNQGGKAMSEEQKGEKINFAEVFEKLSETQKDLARKEQELSVTKTDKEGLTSEIAQLKENINTIKERLNAEIAAKDEALKEAKETKAALSQRELAEKKIEAEALATEYLEKGLIKQEEFDAKVESLIKLDKIGIDEARALVAKFEKPKTQEGKVGKFTSAKNPMKDETFDFDKLSEKEKMQAAIHDFLFYEDKFKVTEEFIEGVSFMGAKGLKNYKKFNQVI